MDTNLVAETTYTYTVRAVNGAGTSASSGAVSGTTSFTPLNPNQITLVDPTIAANATLGSYPFRGRAGAAFTNGLTWSNPLTGSNGIISFPGGNVTNGWEWTTNIALGAGANTVTFSGSYATASTQTLSDIPANYSNWSNGITGGTGFGAWSLTSSGSGGHFLANNPTNMNVGSTTGFGLWANSGGTSTATRNFNTAMVAGDSFALRFDNNWLVDGGETGFTLADSNGVARLRFYFVGGQGNYRISDATTARDSGWDYTANGLNLTISLGAGNGYILSDGTRNVTGNLGAAGGAISRLIVENKNAGPDTPYNLYIGAMTHTRQISESGTVTTNAATLTLSAMTDGLADSWWATYGITGTNRVAANDADGDGFSNAQEHSLGTDPMNAGSSFRAGEVSRSGNNVTISWSAVPGKTYQVQMRPSLTSGSWTDVGLPVTAAGPTASATVDVSSAPNACFLRVKHGP